MDNSQWEKRITYNSQWMFAVDKKPWSESALSSRKQVVYNQIEALPQDRKQFSKRGKDAILPSMVFHPRLSIMAVTLDPQSLDL